MEELKYIVLEKAVGETPLACLEAWRKNNTNFANVPLAYAGRLDPMASGKLLILIGEECKVQEKYHGLDKQYEFSVLFGASSDTGDVLGRLSFSKKIPQVTTRQIKKAAKSLVGDISLPYPHFSSKTVKGKPLHVWALEGRLNEISIPKQTSKVYSLELKSLRTLRQSEIYAEISRKIETIPEVKDESKALGRDFRRTDIRSDWQRFSTLGRADDKYFIATFVCNASSGTYMRSLAEEIGRKLGSMSLAYHIHRTLIGRFRPWPLVGGFWTKRF